MSMLLKNLNRQHAELLEMSAKIRQLIEDADVDWAKLVSTLNIFSGKLLIHLAAEDNGLYPTLLLAADPLVKATATKFLTEQGGLVDAFTTYRADYQTAAQIQNSFPSFRRQTHDLLTQLEKRIRRESKELYPLLG